MIAELFTAIGSALREISPVVVVHSFEQGVRFRFGRDTARLGPGVYVNVPIFFKVETRPTCEEAMTSPPNAVGTIDGHSIAVGVTVRYVITDLRQWFTEVQDFDATLMNMATTEACRIVGSHTRDAALAKRDDIAAKLGDWLTEEVDLWGVDIISVGFHTFTPTRCLTIGGARP